MANQEKTKYLSLMAKWHKTAYPCIRFKEHATRKHGVQKDKYFAIRYQRDGKRTEEGLGWASMGWTLQKANERLSEIKENQRIGQGPQTLKEKRSLLKAKREKEQVEQERQAKMNTSFSSYFMDIYFPIAQTSKKQTSYAREITNFRLWIKPVFKDKSFKNISPFDCEKIKGNMLNAGRSPRTIQYCFATIRQVWSVAKRDGLVSVESPTKYVSIPKIDNKRLRFLTHSEADTLLKELAKLSIQLHDEALLSLHCGLRAGELFNLTWSDVHFENGLLTLLDAKSGTRETYMTKGIKSMLAGRKQLADNKFVFPNRAGEKTKRISTAFAKTVDAIGLNDHVIDKRQKVVFHTMRHTFGSWHVQAGTDLYTLQTLLGHHSFRMVQRYAHLGETTLQNAVKNLEKNMNKQNNVIELRKEKSK